MREILKKIESHRLNHRPDEYFSKYDRCKMLIEEIFEYMSADNRADELDALIDLSIFALDTAFIMGISSDKLEEAIGRVVEANSQKIVCKTDRCDYDLIKPKGWTPPNLRDLV